MNHLRFYAGTNSVYIPISGVIIIQMNLSKSNSWLPLPSPIKETMMNSHPNASVTNVRRVCSNEHSLVMLCKVTSKSQKQNDQSVLLVHYSL